MTRQRAERRALQAAIVLFGFVPVLAGLGGVAAGLDVVHATGDASAHSHMRYLSGLLLGIGIAFWAAVPRIEAHGARVRLLAGIVVIGGVARFYGLVADGAPDAPMVFALVMELVVTPSIAVWQGRVARVYGPLLVAAGEAPPVGGAGAQRRS